MSNERVYEIIKIAKGKLLAEEDTKACSFH